MTIVLTEDLKQIALNQYHPIIDIDLWSLEQENYDIQNNTTDAIIINDTVNLKILNADIEQMLLQNNEDEYKEYQKYVSKPQTTIQDGTEQTINTGTFTNIIFTPRDENIIIPYEYYKGVFYLSLPQFYRQISLHILMPYVDASDNVVLFTTEDAIDYVNTPSNPTTKWKVYSNTTTRDDDKINIISEDGVGRYLIDLPETLRHLPTIEIDVFYKYATIGENQIGLIDTLNRGYDDIEIEYREQQTLINQNINTAKQIVLTTRQTHDLTEDDAFSYSAPLDSIQGLQHTNNIIYEATIKYLNDNIYVEEYNQRTSDIINRINELKTNNNYNYKFIEWPVN